MYLLIFNFKKNIWGFTMAKKKINIIIFLLMIFTFSVISFGFSLNFGQYSATNDPKTSGLNASSPVNTYNHKSPLSLLVYTEFVDVDQELVNTMNSIENDYGSNFHYTNLTDYTKLSAELPGNHVFLIPEQEEANSTMTETIGTIWSSTLQSYVNDGGIVILMDYASPVPNYGVTANIYNKSGLMSINSATNRYTTTVTLDSTESALARGVSSSWSGPSGTLSYDTNDYTFRVVNYGSEAVVAHKIMGQGHIILLGFDMFNIEGNCTRILGNAIRLHKHIIFEESHSPAYDIFSDLAAYQNRLNDFGYAVSKYSKVFNNRV
jgi:hypothetical protein